jgi:hypothetical protein
VRRGVLGGTGYVAPLGKGSKIALKTLQMPSDDEVGS